MSVAVVVKVGGGMLARARGLEPVLAEIAAASRACPLLVVTGGGPFADAVRDVDRRLGLTDEAAHWMAVLAMDQYAHLVASRVAGGKVVLGRRDVEAALDDQCVPVLAPYQWLREVDPLPHSWDVTSDSIAAWVAGQVGASHLVLVKPAGASGPGIVDPFFDRLLPVGVKTAIVSADRIDELRAALTRPG